MIQLAQYTISTRSKGNNTITKNVNTDGTVPVGSHTKYTKRQLQAFTTAHVRATKTI